MLAHMSTTSAHDQTESGHSFTDSAPVISRGWLTLQRGAEYADSHPCTLRRAIHDGKLRYTKVGGRKSIRLRPEWIDAWLEGE